MKQSAAIKSLVAHINAKQPKKAMAPKRESKKYPRLRFIAEQEPQEMGAAIQQLTPIVAAIGEKLAAMSDALGLRPIPQDAPVRVRIAARRKYAAEFRRIAQENPEQFAEMLNGIYKQLDEVVDKVEALAENTDVELEPSEVDEQGIEFGVSEAEEPAEAVADKVDEVRDEAAE